MTASPLTIAIVARDAAATIRRAVASCLSEPSCHLLLIDDQCTDDTVRLARSVAGDRLRLRATSPPGGVGAARQLALDTADTPFAAFLDADDEWVPGRAERLVRPLRSGVDIVADAIDLVDGPSGTWLRRLEAARVLRAHGGTVRLFERNLLAGDTQVAFRVEAFSGAGGFDPDLTGAESYDILLRAVRAGATWSFLDTVGYRMHAYAGSLSRDLARQRAMLARVLRKHEYPDVARLYAGAGWSERIAWWALVAMALYRGEPAEALSWLARLEPLAAGDRQVLEPDGPWPQPERWRVAFYQGTARLLLGTDDREALAALSLAEQWLPTAEGANNRGVALARLGRDGEAREAFAEAARRCPGYLDATSNAMARQPVHVTTHPLRHVPSRREYPSEGPIA